MAQVTDTLTNLKDVTQTTKILEQAINDPNELTSEAKVNNQPKYVRY